LLRPVNLSVKLTICLIGGMVAIFSVLGYRIIRLHRENLEEATFAAGDRITDTIKRSTRYSMLHNQSNEIHQIITAIGSQPGIEKIRIFNKAGEVRCSTDEREISARVDKNAEGCYACHVQTGPFSGPGESTPHQLSRAERTRIYDNGGERILSVVNPIANEPGCSTAACHAHSPDMKVLGMINVRMTLAPVDAAIAYSRRQMVTSFVLAICILSLVFVVLIRGMVHTRVQRLIVGTNRVAAGDLDYKIKVSSHDEVGELAKSFNRMTSELKQADAELGNWARTLETRVEEKTAELKLAHDHIVSVEKLASIGKLAAIVAHEINNPLAGILVYAKGLLKRMNRSGAGGREDQDAKRKLEIIASETARCGEIVKGLLQFSRQAKPSMESNDLNELIRDSLRLVRHKTDLMGVRTEIRLDEQIGSIVCDAQQIKQALVALLINACEAVPQNEGVLTIESRHTPGGPEISIADNGAGMDEETRKQIFEPFFTTKEQGKGVGLGLSVVYGIVLGHRGEIEVESAPGRGSVFTIRLPGEVDHGDE
jgi:two-component system NtrC family sensor kinase